MLNLTANLDPIALALFPHRICRRSEIRVLEGAERDRDKPVELPLVLVEHVRPAFRTEVVDAAVTAVGDHHERLRLPRDRYPLGRPARLHRKGAARPLLAVEAVAHGDA